MITINVDCKGVVIVFLLKIIALPISESPDAAPDTPKAGGFQILGGTFACIHELFRWNVELFNPLTDKLCCEIINNIVRCEKQALIFCPKALLPGYLFLSCRVQTIWACIML